MSITYESQVWLNNAEFGEQSLRLLVLDRGMYDDVIARYPVDGSCDTMLVAGLERIKDAKNFGGVTTSRSRVRENQSDGLLRVDDENL
jgi:hypothetical protein